MIIHTGQETMESYCNELTRFLMVCLRLYPGLEEGQYASLKAEGVGLDFTEPCQWRLRMLGEWVQAWNKSPPGDSVASQPILEAGARTLHAFFFSVISGGLNEQSLRKGVVMYFGILAITPVGWKNAIHLTGYFAKFKYLIRMAIIQQVLLHSEDSSQ